MGTLTTSPAIVWLKVTDYMQVWLEHELGGEVSVNGRRVISVQHLRGARKILRRETASFPEHERGKDSSMSATRYNVLDTCLEIDATAAEQLYGIDRETLGLFMPIECPKMTLTRHGVLRPWSLDTNFSRRQANALMDLLRQEFWNAVEIYDEGYARRMNYAYYPAVDMIEAFCRDTDTSEMYVDPMRREWQRRQKREQG